LYSEVREKQAFSHIKTPKKKKKKKNPITNCSMSKEQLRALASMVIKDGPAK
jgi:hypothetical protein